jgi:predicted transcriptional regulator YheO
MFKMLPELTLHTLKQIAYGIAQQFGSNCEVVIHDLTDNNTESSIVDIVNGHVTNRKPGDGPSHVVLEALHGDRSNLHDHLNYLTKTKDGKILKSSTIYIRDGSGEAIGVFGINFDITSLLMIENSIKPLITTETGSDKKEPERISQNVNDLLDELIEQSVRLVGKPVALMTKDDKINAIQFLNNTGAFLITKSGDKVSKYFGISKYTLYSYIDAKN